jgi:hypothetical protein
MSREVDDVYLTAAILEHGPFEWLARGSVDDPVEEHRLYIRDSVLAEGIVQRRGGRWAMWFDPNRSNNSDADYATLAEAKAACERAVANA